MKVELRLWTPKDIKFACTVRNSPELMRWFRQSEFISYKQQEAFILTDIKWRHYNGFVILANGKPAGLCGVKNTLEFTIGVLPEYQKKGIATKAMKLLMGMYPKMWSHVFVDNPALTWYIRKLGFKAVGVKERAYHKEGVGLIDVVKIAHE